MVTSFMGELVQQMVGRTLTQIRRACAAVDNSRPVSMARVAIRTIVGRGNSLGRTRRRQETGELRVPALRRVLDLLALISLLLCLHGCDADAPAPLAGGGEVRFAELEGRWLFINYWAEWCAPCREEIPELNELYENRAAYGVEVLGVNYDGVVGEKLVDVMEKMNIRFPVLVNDPRERWGYEQPTALPVTIVVAPDGGLRKQLLGPQSLDMLVAATRSATSAR